MGRTSRISRRRYGAVVVAGVTALIAGSGCGSMLAEAEPEAVVIGVDLELTGGGADLGNALLAALELRVAEVNEQGLLGDRQLELEVLDNRSDESTAVTNLTTLAGDASVTAIIAGACDQCMLSAIDTLNERRVATIALGRADAIAEPVAERRYIFKLGPDAGTNAVLLRGELERAGVESIALVTTSDPYGEDGLREMKQVAQPDPDQPPRIEVPVEAQIAAGEPSVGQAAARIVEYQPEVDESVAVQGQVPEQDAQAGPDAVVVWAPPEATGEVAVALREAGYDGPLYLDAFAAGELFLSGAEAAALDGATMVFTETLVIDDAIAISPAKTARQSWFRTYTSEFGTYHAYSSFAADAVNVVVDAINRADSTDRERVRNAMEITLLDGLSGTIRFNTETHSGLAPQAVTTVVAQGDRWRLSG